MQVRIRKNPFYCNVWVVEKKYFFWPFWIHISDNGKDSAIQIAKEICNPKIEFIGEKRRDA